LQTASPWWIVGFMSDTSIRNEAPIGPDYTAVASGAVHKLSIVTPVAAINGHGACQVCPGSSGGLGGGPAAPAGFALAAAADGAQVQVQTSRPVSGTTAEWDARTGNVGGLVEGLVYYVDHTTAGNITHTIPGSGNVKPVGYALNAVTMLPIFVLPFPAIG
jgi:hypothetical protein